MLFNLITGGRKTFLPSEVPVRYRFDGAYPRQLGCEKEDRMVEEVASTWVCIIENGVCCGTAARALLLLVDNELRLTPSTTVSRWARRQRSGYGSQDCGHTRT